MALSQLVSRISVFQSLYIAVDTLLNTCLKIGSALKNEFGDRGFDLFLQFCSKTDNFEANWVKATWRSVKAHRASIGLIYHLAQDSSCFPPESKVRVVKAPPISNVLDLDDARRIRFAQQLWMACKTDDQVVAEHPYAMAKEIAWAAGAGLERVAALARPWICG